MDDLIGTQTPRTRITDPARAVRALEQAVPGLADYRRPEPARLDWPLIEKGLGTGLPADFKLLATHYPAFVLDDFLLVRLPEPGTEHYWLRGTYGSLEIVQEWWDADMSIGLRPYPAPGGLLPGWAESNEGDKFLWTTINPDPDEWLVTVASRNHDWWHYAGGPVQFLAELIDGTLESWALPPIRPDVTVIP